MCRTGRCVCRWDAYQRKRNVKEEASPLRRGGTQRKLAPQWHIHIREHRCVIRMTSWSHMYFGEIVNVICSTHLSKGDWYCFCHELCRLTARQQTEHGDYSDTMLPEWIEHVLVMLSPGISQNNPNMLLPMSPTPGVVLHSMRQEKKLKTSPLVISRICWENRLI